MVNPPKIWWVFGTGCVLVLACEAQEAPRSVPERAQGEFVLTRTEEYPCTLQFRPTGVVLRADVEGSVPDPGATVSRGPDGRFATPNFNGEGVGLWSQGGEFLGALGRRGEGPGEFGDSPLPIFDEHGQIHVFDPTMGRWSRFTENGDLISSITTRLLSNIYLPGRIAVLGGDSALLSAPSPLSSDRFYFRILSRDGGTRGFAELPSGAPTGYHARPISYGRDGRFWAGPWQGAPEYVLEEWTLDGTLLRRLRRDPPWDVERVEAHAQVGTNPLPRFPMLAEGPDGELIILAVVSGPGDDLSSNQSIELWYEVIDPHIPDVLASKQVLVEGPVADNVPPMFGILPGTRLGFRQSLTELKVRATEILEYELVPHNRHVDPSACGP